MRAGAKIVALLGGVALTTGAVIVGLLRLGELVHGPACSCRSKAHTRTLQDDTAKRVKLGPRGLYYFEGENSLRLTAELASDKRGSFYIVYVWSPQAWPREMPEWCRHRRDEVLPEIKRLTADRRIEWVEED
jgi:hypothetical protein